MNSSSKSRQMTRRTALKAKGAFQEEGAKPFNTEEALAGAFLVVLLLTPGALESKTVQKEVMATMKKKKPFWIVHPLRSCPFIWPELQKPQLPELEEMIQARKQTF